MVGLSQGAGLHRSKAGLGRERWGAGGVVVVDDELRRAAVGFLWERTWREMNGSYEEQFSLFGSKQINSEKKKEASRRRAREPWE